MYSFENYLNEDLLNEDLLNEDLLESYGLDEARRPFGRRPFGRIGSGVAELIAAVLLLIPRTTLVGALLSCGEMFGAIASHILILGYEVQNDGGTLFILALITFICSAALVFIYKNQIFNLLKLKL